MLFRHRGPGKREVLNFKVKKPHQLQEEERPTYVRVEPLRRVCRSCIGSGSCWCCWCFILFSFYTTTSFLYEYCTVTPFCGSGLSGEQSDRWKKTRFPLNMSFCQLKQHPAELLRPPGQPDLPPPARGFNQEGGDDPPAGRARTKEVGGNYLTYISIIYSFVH